MLQRIAADGKKEGRARNVLLLGDSTDKIWTLSLCGAQLRTAAEGATQLHTSSPVGGLNKFDPVDPQLESRLVSTLEAIE